MRPKEEFFIIERNCMLCVVRAETEERDERRASIMFDGKSRDIYV